MQVRFVVDGAKYSRQKSQFKRILADHRLSWRGSTGEFVWASGKERVRADYERDEARDVTIRATLTWEGKAKTPLLNELKAWVFALGGSTDVMRKTAALDAAAKARVEAELDFWDKMHKPDEKALRAAGRPAAWIEADVRRWKTARAARRRELLLAQNDDVRTSDGS